MTTDERFEKVEGQLARVRWINRCLIGCIVVALGLWFILKTFGPETAWAQSGAKEIRAKRFVLEDENGKTRADLRVDKNGPSLRLCDENEKARVRLMAFKDATCLALTDENGKPRAAFVVDMDKSALMLSDENGKPRAVFEVEKDRPVLSYTDENGKLLWSAP